MQPTTTLKNFVTESALWTLASAVGVAVPAVTAYLVLHTLMGMPLFKVSVVVYLTVLLTLTWGSWSGLVWAKNLMLRAAMRTMTVLPGLLLMVLTATGFYTGRGSLLVWAGLGLTGLGTVAVSFMLARQVSMTPASQSPTRFLTGLGVFPFLATLGSGSVFYLWYAFLNNPVQHDWRAIFSLAFFFVSTLSIVLISTVVPALTTLVCRRLAAPRA